MLFRSVRGLDMLVQSVIKAMARWLTMALEERARQQSIRCSGVACIPPGVLQQQVSKPLRSQNSDVNVSSTDIDDTSLEFARKNVLANALQDRISVVQADANGPVLFPLLHGYKFLCLGKSPACADVSQRYEVRLYFVQSPILQQSRRNRPIGSRKGIWS